MRSIYKIISDKFLSKLLLRNLNLLKKKNFLNFRNLFISGNFFSSLDSKFYEKFFQSKLKNNLKGKFKKRMIKKSFKSRVRVLTLLKPKPKINLLSTLTKKQKKRVNVTKLHKLIRPSSSSFSQFTRYPRSSLLNLFYLNKQVLIHDGYSWHLFLISKEFLNYRAGFLCFKTRALSPISLSLKGKPRLKMAQKNTFKIKSLKVKRKK